MRVTKRAESRNWGSMSKLPDHDERFDVSTRKIGRGVRLSWTEGDVLSTYPLNATHPQ